MERRDKKEAVEDTETRLANLGIDLKMAYRQTNILLDKLKESEEEYSKLFSLYVRECSKNRPNEKVAGWRKINPEGLKKLQNPKGGLTWERVAPQILKAVQNKGEKKITSVERLRKLIEILERCPV